MSFNRYYSCVFTALLSIFSYSFSEENKGAEEIEMFLCVDSNSANAQERKTVYGYIDGKKTECMPEYEFRALYNKRRFEQEKKEQEPQDSGEESSGEAETVKAILKGRRALKGADLGGYDLMGIDLTGADLREANLESADMRRVVLRYAKLQGANLSYAFLRKADMRNTDLTGSILKGAYLHETDLSGAKGITAESFKEVKTLYDAKIDSALMIDVKEQYPEKFNKPDKCWESNRWAKDTECDEKRVDYPLPKMPE